MEVVILEGDLEFTFSDEWKVIKLDDSTYYSKKSRQVQRRKSVDIAALHQRNNIIILMEIKDYRGRSKERLEPSGDIVDDIVEKMHDSLATIAGGARCAGGSEPWPEIGTHLVNRSCRLFPVFWLEERSYRERIPEGRSKNEMSVLQDKLKVKLKTWLSSKACVIDSSTYASIIPDMNVKRMGIN